MTQKKEITIYDIAAQLEISPATVSRGLKDNPAVSKKTRKKILDTAKKLGYRSNNFASNLRRSKTNTLGVIVPRLNSSFISDVLAGIEKVANNAGYNLIISQSLENEKKEIANAATMFHSRVDGLLVSLAYDTQDIEHFRPFLERDIPILFFDRVFKHEKCSCIVIDNVRAAYEITSHLLDQGCRDIFHVTGNLKRNVYEDRLTGFKQALAERDIAFNAENLLVNNLSPQAGIETAAFLLSRSRLPDAVFVTNDICVASCMAALKKQGIQIPADILFAGFNNDYISTIVEPNLTTINYNGFEMGEIAAQNLIQHLSQENQPKLPGTIVVHHDLIIRQSSQKLLTR